VGVTFGSELADGPGVPAEAVGVGAVEPVGAAVGLAGALGEAMVGVGLLGPVGVGLTWAASVGVGDGPGGRERSTIPPTRAISRTASTPAPITQPTREPSDGGGAGGGPDRAGGPDHAGGPPEPVGCGAEPTGGKAGGPGGVHPGSGSGGGAGGCPCEELTRGLCQPFATRAASRLRSGVAGGRMCPFLHR